MRAIRVAVGVLQDATGRVLLARRPASSHQGGLWEFPGGKCEAGETPRAALRRELAEELGIEVVDCRPLIRVRHDYGDRRVILDTWLVNRWFGAPEGREGQPLEWVAGAALAGYPMPAADRPILSALNLPQLYAITPARIQDEESFLRQLKATLRQGIRLLQFRVFDSPERWRRLAARACRLCGEAGARLLVNSTPEMARRVGAHGVHLNRQRLMSPGPSGDLEGLLTAASCHDERELHQAQTLGLDFAVLSPVLPTASHPGAEPLGWERFSQLVEPVSLPVYALGGLRPEMVGQAWRNGAQGIAGIRGLWSVRG
ncbi:MAG TPA: Nudix family hydrolase [Chromatiaceae bacterium]|nr:Nudix family hydrolase [Chromatiaceae bacterium]